MDLTTSSINCVKFSVVKLPVTIFPGYLRLKFTGNITVGVVGHVHRFILCTPTGWLKIKYISRLNRTELAGPLSTVRRRCAGGAQVVRRRPTNSRTYA